MRAGQSIRPGVHLTQTSRHVLGGRQEGFQPMTQDGYVFAGTSKSADAPDIEAAIYDAKFDGVSTKEVTGGQYGDGERLVWAFTILDDEGDVLYDAGEPIELDGLTSMSTNVASKTTPKAVRYLKALMTPAEFAEFEAGNGIPASDLVGRVVQVEVAIRDSGWPTIANVLPARKRRVSAGRKSAEVEE